jgi:hypothetical protein
MSTLNMYISLAIGAIVIYLIVDGQNSNQVLSTLSSANVSAIKALQGR